MEISKCQYPDNHHSDDLVEIWHGESLPIRVCGFHNQSVSFADIKAAMVGPWPRTINGQTVWACCVSLIGAPCLHKTHGVDVR